MADKPKQVTKSTDEPTIKLIKDKSKVKCKNYLKKQLALICFSAALN